MAPFGRLDLSKPSTTQCARISLAVLLLGMAVFPTGACAGTLPGSGGAWPGAAHLEGNRWKVIPGDGLAAHAADKVSGIAYGFAADDPRYQAGVSSNAGLEASGKSYAPASLTFDGAVDVLGNSDSEFSSDHQRSSSFASEDRTEPSPRQLYALGVGSKDFGAYANTRYCVRYGF